MRRIARSTLQTAINLVFFAVLATAVLASTFFLTRDEIKKSEDAEKMKLINQLVPTTLYDNDIIKDTCTTTTSSRTPWPSRPTSCWARRTPPSPTARASKARTPPWCWNPSRRMATAAASG